MIFKQLRYLPLTVALTAGLVFAWGTNDNPSLLTPVSLAAGSHQAEMKMMPKPWLVEVHADWCKGCQNIAPALSQLKNQYKGKVDFITLDVTNAKTAAEAAEKAKSLGLSDWFEKNRSKTSMVALVCPMDKAVMKTFVNEANSEVYAKELNSMMDMMQHMNMDMKK